MPKGKRGARKTAPASSSPQWDDETDKSFEEFWQKCHDAALWSLEKSIQVLMLLYGLGVLGLLYSLRSATRGGKSLASLGTAALLMLAWAAVIGSGAVMVEKVGWTTLLFLGALAFGLFRYYGPVAGMLVIGVYSVAGLFLGGSPWWTLLVALGGGVLFYVGQTSIALLGTLCYAAYSIYRMGGFFALAATFFATCLSNDLLRYLAANIPLESETPKPEEAKEQEKERPREWNWKDSTGGSGWGAGTSQQSSQENFRNSAYGGGRGTPDSGRGGRGRGETREGKREEASTSGSSTSWGGGTKSESPNGFPRTASYAEDLGDAEAEVARIMSCSTHYTVLELSRGGSVDLSEAKKLYHRKARLVHPDKNNGCANAGEAFKCLQQAYETLIDPVKRKDYEEELKSRELTDRLNKMAEEHRNRSQNRKESHKTSAQNAHPAPNGAFAGFDPDDLFREGNSRRVHCHNCGEFHEWLKTERPKNKCRWCAECNKFHGAAEGDGWFEQTSKPLFFGLFKQDEQAQAFCVEGGTVYLCTSWVECQGMVGRPNTHKPSFEIKSEGRSRGGGGRGPSSGGRGRSKSREPDVSECFESEEDFWSFMEDLMRNGGTHASPGGRGASAGRGGKTKPSKKQQKKQKRSGW